MGRPALTPVCPCGGLWLADARRLQTPRPFATCCGRHVGDAATGPASTAEALMRSRYTAFVRGDTAHLLATWHPEHRPATLALDPGVRWLGLEVRAHRVIDDRHAEVEFVAQSREPGGRAHRLHERSRFERGDDGQWRYVDGDIIPA